MKYISAIIYIFLGVSEVLSPPNKAALFKDLNREEAARLVGGQKAKRHQFPYMVSIQYQGKHFCGGALITTDRVLTAAHCKIYGDGKYYAVLGMLNRDEKHEDIQTIEVKAFSILPKTVPKVVASEDIAFLVLSKPVKLSTAVNLIPLPTVEQCDAQGITVLGGWGLMEFSTSARTLMWAEMQRIPNDQCKNKLFELLKSYEPLERTMICTSTNDEISACNGDSGGPLVYNGTVVGVVSWGVSPCGTKGAPTVFTRVCDYLDYVRGPVRNGVHLYNRHTLIDIVLITCICRYVLVQIIGIKI